LWDRLFTGMEYRGSCVLHLLLLYFRHLVEFRPLMALNSIKAPPHGSSLSTDNEEPCGACADMRSTLSADTSQKYNMACQAIPIVAGVVDVVGRENDDRQCRPTMTVFGTALRTSGEKFVKKWELRRKQ